MEPLLSPPCSRWFRQPKRPNRALSSALPPPFCLAAPGDERPSGYKHAHGHHPGIHVRFGGGGLKQDIWDVSKITKVGSCQASCASSLDWSPDSAYLLAAVLSPKIRVDNGYASPFPYYKLLKVISLRPLRAFCDGAPNRGRVAVRQE
jgi:hypothetical protein